MVASVARMRYPLRAQSTTRSIYGRIERSRFAAPAPISCDAAASQRFATLSAAARLLSTARGAQCASTARPARSASPARFRVQPSNPHRHMISRHTRIASSRTTARRARLVVLGSVLAAISCRDVTAPNGPLNGGHKPSYTSINAPGPITVSPDSMRVVGAVR